MALGVSVFAQRDTMLYNQTIPQLFTNHDVAALPTDTVHDGEECHITLELYPGTRSGLVDYRDGFFAGRENVFGFHTDSTLHVVGIAAIFHSVFPGDTQDCHELYFLSERPVYSIKYRLYTLEDDSLILQRRFEIDSPATTFDTANCWLYYIPDSVVPHLDRNIIVWDSYFENEIDVSDSFFVSAFYSPYYDTGDILIFPLFAQLSEWHASYNYDNLIYPTCNVRYRENDTNGLHWQKYSNHFIPLIWPIIRRDCDTCPTVQGLQAFRASATQAFFRWNRGAGHRDWQLSYGPVGTAPEDGTLLDFQQPLSSVIDLSPDTHYVAYVRARCRFARYEYGPWSAPVTVDLGSGIDEATVAQFLLSPNPAAGQVTVTAEEGLRHIEVYDARGALVYSAAADGTTAVVETKAWPAGQYVVTVETRAGKGSRVLTVAR